MTGKSPIIALNNGIEMPAVGLGVYQSSPEDTAKAVTTAIGEGYRLVDTAAAYGNEVEVGEGVRASGVDRSELFVTTKLWMSDYGYDQTLHGFDRSMRKLGLDQLDLYLLHWPVPTNFDTTVASYRAAEKLLGDGRVRAIGVCNFSASDLDALVAQTDIVPAVNQVELHPFFIQQDLRDAHQRMGIVTQAWSPIGGVNVYSGDDSSKNPLDHDTVKGLAEKYGKTPAQIVLRWQIEHGNSAIPKSVHANRIIENISIFDFSLAADEVAAIDAIDSGQRGGPNPAEVNPELFAMKIED